MANTTRSTVDTTLVKRGHSNTKYDTFRMQELKKCLNDPVYFAETYVKIQHPTKGGIPFEMWEFQRELIRIYAENRYSVSLLPRQSGKCVVNQTLIRVRNKKTGEIVQTTMGDFFEKAKLES